MSEFTTVDGGVTAPQEFKAAGVSAGIKASKPDLALIVSERPAAVAGVFTTNRIQAAPVRICREKLTGKQATAIVVNSGNANACTGARGEADVRRMAMAAAEELGVEEKTVFVCSTGIIGAPLPMDKIETGIGRAAELLSEDGGDSAARAIMTTDTTDKQVALEFGIDGIPVRLGGMAKGSGMIEPNMATLLAFLTTDAAVDSESLQDCLTSAVNGSFNRISVDGAQSTNDTVLFMANGGAGTGPLNEKHPDWNVFAAAVGEVTNRLARKIVKDGEGATKFVTVRVTGAVSVEGARKAARAVANSPLVKTSWYGEDPNWGRIISAIGCSGAEVNEGLVSVCYDNVCAVMNGCAAAESSLKDLGKVLAQSSFSVNIDLNLGDNTDTVYTCDCSEEYVRINSEYIT